MASPTGDKATFTCVARRHMGAEFHVYDAMLAICKAAAKKLEDRGEWKDGDTLPLCFVREHILANMVDRSIVQVSEAIGKLTNSHWIKPTRDVKERQRRRKGDFTSNEYRVVTHDEYIQENPDSCPALRYEPETGEPIKAGTLSVGLKRARIRKITGLERTPIPTEPMVPVHPDMPGVDWKDEWPTGLPGVLADKVSEAIESRKTTKGNPCLDDSAREGNPFTTRQGNPLTATKGNPLTSVKGNPLTSLKGEAGTVQTGTVSPPAPENAPGAISKGGQAGWMSGSSASSTKTQWQEFISKARALGLHSALLSATPKTEEFASILARLKKCGDVEEFVDDINDWVELQSPPLAELWYGRWSRWLEQTQDEY